MAGPLRLYERIVPEAWLDYNNHMTEGYYGVAFGEASDEFLLHIGFDADYRATHRGAFYTVETHIRFLQEMDLGDRMAIDTIVLGADAKRVHLFHTMINLDRDFEAATQEVLMLHVNRDEVKVRPMGDALLAALLPIAESHQALGRPDAVGRSVKPVG